MGRVGGGAGKISLSPRANKIGKNQNLLHLSLEDLNQYCSWNLEKGNQSKILWKSKEEKLVDLSQRNSIDSARTTTEKVEFVNKNVDSMENFVGPKLYNSFVKLEKVNKKLFEGINYDVE